MKQLTLLWAILSALFTNVSNLYIGQGVNIFQNFGNLVSLFNKHSSKHDSTQGVQVFKEIYENTSYSNQTELRVELCGSLKQLQQALYRHSEVQGSAVPWLVLAGSQSTAQTAARLGIHPGYVTISQGYSYGLVRFTRYHKTVTLQVKRRLELSKRVAQMVKSVVPGQKSNVLQFMSVVGTHYVSSYTEGHSLHQVFVFNPAIYKKAEAVATKSPGEVLRYFTPWYAEHIGRVVSWRSGAGEDNSVRQWSKQFLRTRVSVFNYESLLKLQGAPEMAELLHGDRGGAVLSLTLRSLTPVLTGAAGQWYQEVFSNILRVWEVNS